MRKKIIPILIASGLAFHASGQGQEPSSGYLKMMNSYVPGSPEAAQIIKYQDFPVNLFTGTPDISIPIYNAAGKGISFPVSVSYHAGGGIKIDDQAGNTGLGWNLNAGGEITREIRGLPDERAGKGLFDKPYPVSYYIQTHVANGLRDEDAQFWVTQGFDPIDWEPDVYYFSAAGLSGKFMYDDEAGVFVSLNRKQQLKISYDRTAQIWLITGDDGTRYYFINKEYSENQVEAMGVSVQPFGPASITSWKLSKIINADATDSIVLNYVPNAYYYYTAGTSAVYHAEFFTTPFRPNLNSFVNNHITGISKLQSVVSTTDSISFVDATENRLDLYQQKAVSKVIICTRGGGARNIFKFNYSYYNRPQLVGDIPLNAESVCKYSLKLDSLTEYGNSETNAFPLTHRFTYNTDVALPCRMSYNKDFWGYTNNNTYEATLAPSETIIYPTYSQYYEGADRKPDAALMQAGILKGIQLPTGGNIAFEYEPNDISYPTEQAGGVSFANVMHLLQEFKSGGQYFNSTYTKSFVVDEEANQALNEGMEGVIANISITPAQPGNPTAAINTANPYFILEGTSSDPNTPNTHIELQYGNRNNVFLPNGNYTMTAYVSPLNNSSVSQDTRVFSFKVSYKILDSTAQAASYIGGGLRIKSITAKDKYLNTTSKRSFKYHNPVSDSSYGVMLSPMLNSYIELLNDLGQGAYYVRMGKTVMANSALAASSVVYPKVIEDVEEGDKVYRTEHIYSYAIPGYDNNNWPFVPPFENEAASGNVIGTNIYQWKPTGFQLAKHSSAVYDYDPTPQDTANSSFIKAIMGLRSTFDSYTQTTGGAPGGGPSNSIFVPFGIKVYSTLYNRAYLSSDSTVTYDLSSIGKSITQWHDYAYGDHNQQPIVIRTGNSDGSLSIQKNWYAMDQPEANTNINAGFAAQLADSNRVSLPLGTRQYKDGQLLSQQYTYAHFDGSKLLVDSLRQALFGNSLETEIKVLAYDAKANPLTIAMRGGKYRKYIWNSQKNLPLATAVMPTDGFFYFSSFEYGDGTAGSAFSGSNARQLPFSLITAAFGPTDVYVWATGSAFSVNGITPVNTGKTKGSWTLYKAQLSGGTNINIASGASIRIDQLVALPAGSQFQGNVYDSDNRVTAVVNDQMVTGFFEYDNSGRLKAVRDEQGNILKSSDYQYQGPQ
ncbi:hypothetical protein F0919_02405 [Taibaiella lutea]|uniref:YD repeat-containing protein n=1 Tax=Taibaiella lutea TaxID=2608001 RepID=A0A5M6CQ83_9BACT|nr:RHS repeat domain-containing protein [Taibaiella lutea]KAA5536540.1 hypothetical protein F0919_02405 [Taibaiella lutea]